MQKLLTLSLLFVGILSHAQDKPKTSKKITPESIAPTSKSLCITVGAGALASATVLSIALAAELQNNGLDPISLATISSMLLAHLGALTLAYKVYPAQNTKKGPTFIKKHAKKIQYSLIGLGSLCGLNLIRELDRILWATRIILNIDPKIQYFIDNEEVSKFNYLLPALKPIIRDVSIIIASYIGYTKLQKETPKKTTKIN